MTNAAAQFPALAQSIAHPVGVADVAAGVPPACEPGVSPGGPNPALKKHKPYWLNGHYYENPEYPEHIARTLFARAS